MSNDLDGAGQAEALVGLSSAELREYIIMAHGMATGTYCQSDSEMRKRIGTLLERAISADPVMSGFLGRGGPQANRDAMLCGSLS